MATLNASLAVDSFLTSSATRQRPAGHGMGIPLVHVHMAHVTSFPIYISLSPPPLQSKLKQAWTACSYYWATGDVVKLFILIIISWYNNIMASYPTGLQKICSSISIRHSVTMKALNLQGNLCMYSCIPRPSQICHHATLKCWEQAWRQGYGSYDQS